MSRSFSSSLNRVNFGSGATLDDVNVFTWCGWVNITSNGTTRPVMSKGVATKLFRVDAATSSGGFQLLVGMSGTNASARAAAATVPINTWVFMAATFDGSFNPKLFKGLLGGVVAECSYLGGTPIQGVGTVNTDAASDLLIGGDASNDMRGSAAEFMIFPSVLTAGEMTALMYGTYPRNATFYAPLHGNAATEPDYSGNANNGTVTGAVYSVHPPIRNRFGMDSGVASTTAGAPGGGGGGGYSGTAIDYTDGTMTLNNSLSGGGVNASVTATRMDMEYHNDECYVGKYLPINYPDGEIWIQQEYTFDAGFDFAAGMKILRVSAQNVGTGNNYYDYIIVAQTNGLQTGASSDNYQILCQRNGGSTWASFLMNFTRGQKYRLKCRFKIESSDAAGDGAFQMWVDGELKANYSGNLGHSAEGYHKPIRSVLFGGWYSNTGNAPNPAPATWTIENAYIDTVDITALDGGEEEGLISYPGRRRGHRMYRRVA